MTKCNRSLEEPPSKNLEKNGVFEDFGRLALPLPTFKGTYFVIPHDLLSMHAIELANVANWAAFNSNLMIQGSEPISAATCNEYWSQSKCRHNRWMTALKVFEKDLQRESENHDPWPAIEIVTQEIFLSEMLTRVWSAIMIIHDHERRSDELGNIAHSIHIGHVEAKNRAMRLLLVDPTANSEIFDGLNKLRRKVERWTDLLLGQLPQLDVATQFAFQMNRVKDFGEENLSFTSNQSTARQMIFANSMPDDLRQFANRFPANPEINRRIAAGLLNCFSPDRFDSLGLPKSIQRIWLEKTTLDNQMYLESLASLDDRVIESSIQDLFERN